MEEIFFIFSFLVIKMKNSRRQFLHFLHFLVICFFGYFIISPFFQPENEENGEFGRPNSPFFQPKNEENEENGVHILHFHFFGYYALFPVISLKPPKNR